MLNSSGVVKRAKENRVAYVEHMEQLWSGQERKGKQVAYVELALYICSITRQEHKHILNSTYKLINL